MPADDLEDDATWKGVVFSGTEFLGRSAEAVEAEGCTFENVRFTGSRVQQSVLSDSEFTTCDFAAFRGVDVALLRCAVLSSRVTGSSWTSGSFRDVRFQGCRGDMALFRHSAFTTVVFRDCNLQSADFQHAQLRNVRFENCNLAGAQFAHAAVSGVLFDGCTLLDVGGPASLRGATVRGPGGMELALSLARDAGIVIEP